MERVSGVGYRCVSEVVVDARESSESVGGARRAGMAL